MLSSMAVSLGGEALAAVATVPSRPVGTTRTAVKAMMSKVRFMILVASYTASTLSISSVSPLTLIDLEACWALRLTARRGAGTPQISMASR
jgi:hypothetical protein